MRLETRRLNDLMDSSVNPRMKIDDASIAELADSIVSHGIIHPLVICQGGEIIDGHRRARAAKVAGLDEVPVIVADWTNLEHIALVQLITALQRRDLTPMEEAMAYDRLHNELFQPVEEIAEHVGKSESYVAKRLQLVRLPKSAQKALGSGGLLLTVALMIARLPTSESRKKAAQRLVSERGFPVSVEAARNIIERDHMLKLKGAPFRTRAEWPKRKGVAWAESCESCPYRTGNQGVLFDDVESDDLCLDAACYRTKTDIVWKEAVAKHEAKGRKLVPKSEAAGIFDYLGNFYSYTGKWAKLSTKVRVIDDDGETVESTYQKLLGGKRNAPDPLLAQRPDGRAMEVWRRKDLDAALEAAGIKVARGQLAGDPAPKRTSKEERAKARRERHKKAAERDAPIRALEPIRAHVQQHGLDNEAWAVILAASLQDWGISDGALMSFDGAELEFEESQARSDKWFTEQAAIAEEPHDLFQVQAALVELLLRVTAYDGGAEVAPIPALCEMLDIDLAGIEKALYKELLAADKKARAEKKVAAKKAKAKAK